MNGYEHILARQTAWAANREISLVGSQGSRGRLAYTATLDQNLFQPLLPDVRASFAGGDGGELGASGLPGKMQAVHSSSALGVNVFQYWKSVSAIPVIAAACGFCERGSDVSCDMRFEEKYRVKTITGRPPNIDVVIHNRPTSAFRRFAIECKFSEAYRPQNHTGLKQKYLDSAELWESIPRIRTLAERICPDDQHFQHLHPAQLIKHILALTSECGPNGFRLLYLWYDVIGDQGRRHSDEIAEFSKVAEQDGIKFHSLTYQELISRLADEFRADHGAYVRYLTDRYL